MGIKSLQKGSRYAIITSVRTLKYGAAQREVNRKATPRQLVRYARAPTLLGTTAIPLRLP